MKCPNCGNDMKEEIEEVMGEKFKRWYCEKCDTYYTLVAEDYLKSLERIKSACKFYLRYKNKPFLLKEEHPEIKIPDVFFDIGVFGKDLGYNDWLFKFVFGKVLRDE